MDILSIIAELREERTLLDEAILALEKIALQQKPRRGRPPAGTRESAFARPQSGKALRDSKDSPSHLTASPN
jgi:hypothetical protein